MDQTVAAVQVDVDQIVLNSFNARKLNLENPVQRAELDELKKSIATQGLIQPVVLRITTDGKYEVVAGERRFRAVRELSQEGDGHSSILSIVKELSDEEAVAVMLAENEARVDVGEFEAAYSYKAYFDLYGKTPETVSNLSAKIGKEAYKINQALTLLELPEQVLSSQQKGNISAGHVKELTKAGSNDEIMNALTYTLSNRATIKELKAFIENIAPPLKAGLFEKDDCRQCIHNGTIQIDMFTTGDNQQESGKCTNTKCFTAKQRSFIEQRWSQSKAATTLGTNTFRFNTELSQDQLVVIDTEEPNQRCVDCADFASVVNLNCGVVQKRVCVGSKQCFVDLYEKKNEAQNEEQEQSENQGVQDDLLAQTGEVTQAQPKKDKVQVNDKERRAKLIKRSGERGKKHCEVFVQKNLPQNFADMDPSKPTSIRSVVLALALESTSAKKVLEEQGVIPSCTSATEKLVDAIFEIPETELLTLIKDMARNSILQKDNHDSEHMRKSYATRIGIDIQKEWVLTPEYITDMQKCEIVQLGEALGIWKMEKVAAYMGEQKWHKKALMSLKTGQLADLIFKSGIDLAGLVPKEIYNAHVK